LTPDALAALLTALRDKGPHPALTLLQQRPGRRIYRYTGTGAPMIVKWHEPRNLLERIKYLFQPTRPAREFRSARALRAVRVPTAPILAFVENRHWRVWRSSVIIQRALEPGTALNDYLLAGGRAREIGLELARLLARLHDAGYAHRDLHGWNVLLEEKQGRLEPRLVDLDEVYRPRKASPSRCGDDLARLGVLAPIHEFTKIRVFNLYLKARGVPRAQWKDWSTVVFRRAAHIAAGLKKKYRREPADFIRWFSARRDTSPPTV
jgi:tRNA A-37 threonylcarbamoyl transferase component Bud32